MIDWSKYEEKSSEEKPSKIDWSKYEENIPKNKELEKEKIPDWKRKPSLAEIWQEAGKQGKQIGEAATLAYAPELEIPAVARFLSSKLPTIGKYLSTAFANAIPQSIVSASQAPENKLEAAENTATIVGSLSAFAKAIGSGSPYTRLATKLLMGVGGAGIGAAGAQYANLGIPATLAAAFTGGLGGYKLGTPNVGTRVAQDVLKGVEGTDYKPVLEAAERLNISHLTPAEASGSNNAAAMQGGLGKTEGGELLYTQKGKERLESEKNAIKNLFNTIFDKNTEAALTKQLYDVAKPQIIPKEQLSSLKENEIFKDALKDVQNKASYRQKLKDVPENSVQYLDMVKRRMGDQIKSAKRTGDNTEAAFIQETQNELVNLMDKVAPAYQQARGVAERGIVRRNLEKIFNNKPVTGTNFGKYLQNEEKFSELNNNLRNVPEAQQQLADMKTVFGNKRLIDLPTPKASEALSRSNMPNARSSSQDWKQILKEILAGGNYDKTAVKLITNPKEWVSQLDKLKNGTDQEKSMARFIDLLGKASAQKTNQYLYR